MKKELMQSSNLTKPQDAESGRTMVEMLGTLVIIGILSIGGVTGYGRAITNYRTNSAVETAQRQAAIVASEVGLGQAVSPGSVTKLKAPAGYEVAVKSVAGSDSNITTTSPFFGVEIGGNTSAGSNTSTNSNTKTTPLQSEVAKEMLERAMGEWKNVHAFGVKSSDGSRITWLNSTGSSDNGFEKAVGDAKTVIVIVVFASDLSLRPETGLNIEGFDINSGNDVGGDEGDDDETTCPTGTDTSYEGGHATTLTDGRQCYCDTGTVWDTENKTCIEKPNDCKSYKDCNKGEFCDFTANVNSCETAPTSGTCQTIATKPVGGGNYVTSDNVTTYYGGYMDWWTAMDFCAAMGKSPVGAFDRCTTVEQETILVSDGLYGYCTTEDTNGWLLDENDWNGYWTKDLLKDSCGVFTIAFGNGFVGTNARYADGNFYPLCK